MKFRFHVAALAALTAAACSDVSTEPAAVSDRGTTGNLILRDEAPPAVAPIVIGERSVSGWYFYGDVNVSWSITDDVSIGYTLGCEPQVVSSDTPGTTFTCSATSYDGTTTESVTIKRDVTPPVMTIANNGATYTVDQTVNVTCSATDATSGITNPNCGGATNEAWTYGVGEALGIAWATDIAGNSMVDYIRFTVVATSDGVCNLAKRWVTPAGAANSLCQHLAGGRMEQFQRTVNGLIDRGGISSANAATLVSLASAL